MSMLPPPSKEGKKNAVVAQPPSSATLPPDVWEYRDNPANEEVHSRASDAGSVKGDSASDAGSTATMDTSMYAMHRY